MIDNKNSSDFLNEFHWLMDVVHNIDVGLVVLDLDLNVKLWNSFMQNHSAIDSSRVMECSIFDIFPELSEAWFRRKVQTVTVLRNASFTTWEERPYLFRFRNYRPVTGIAEYMYQNCTLLPLTNAHGEVGHICLIIYDVTEVATNRMQLQLANDQLQTISRTDGLTGLLNRHALHELAQRELAMARRQHAGLSLIAIDVDHFKQVNDQHGHAAGDRVLEGVARILTPALRGSDLLFRVGGEEFLVLLPFTELREAGIVAERLRSVIAAGGWHPPALEKITASLGVAQVDPEGETWELAMQRVDQALYAAKATGRNRVVQARPPRRASNDPSMAVEINLAVVGREDQNPTRGQHRA